MIGRSVASPMRLKCASAISGDCCSVNGAGGNTSSAEAPPSAAMRAIRAASRLPSAHMPLMIGSFAPISSCAIASTRRCSSKLQEATSVECALMVMALMPGVAATCRRWPRKLCFVDREVVVERQQYRRDDAVGDVVWMAGHQTISVGSRLTRRRITSPSPPPPAHHNRPGNTTHSDTASCRSHRRARGCPCRRGRTG